jgi:hypothetical protein
MKKEQKRRLIEDVSKNLSKFHEYGTGIFACPTCLIKIPIHEIGKVTEAHILPKAAGFGDATLLCKTCNSNFGARQDKWLGEFLNAYTPGKPFDISKVTQAGHFIVDGVKINGTWSYSETEGIKVFAYDKRNSPALMSQLDEKWARQPKTINLSLPIPLSQKQSDVNVGFITAAYLAWFSMFGYSWVLQKHLDPVRKLIRGEIEKEKSQQFVLYSEEINLQSWLGLMKLKGEILPAFGIGSTIVVLPPKYSPSAAEIGRVSGQTLHSKDLQPITNSRKSNDYPPLIIVGSGKLIVCPDNLARIKARPLAIVVDESGKVHMGQTVTPEEYDKRIKDGNVREHSFQSE